MEISCMAAVVMYISKRQYVVTCSAKRQMTHRPGKRTRLTNWGSVKARLAAAESLNKSLVEKVGKLEKVVEGYGKKIKENDELWQGYSDDMDYLRGERDEFKRENDKEHSEFKSAIEALGKSRTRKLNSGEIRKQLAAERKRREKIAKEKAKS